MENQRSSTMQQSRMQRSTKSSLNRQGESSSPMATTLTNTEKENSAKNFVQSCPYRTDDIDRNAIVK